MIYMETGNYDSTPTKEEMATLKEEGTNQT